MHGLTADGSEGDGQWSGARPHWLHTQSARAACRGAHAQSGRLPPPLHTSAGGILLRGMHGLCESERGEVRLLGAGVVWSAVARGHARSSPWRRRLAPSRGVCVKGERVM